MDASALKNLIELLREAGVTFYKSPEVELHLTPLPPRQLVKDPEVLKEEIPEAFRKLPGNYRHPALGLMKRGA